MKFNLIFPFRLILISLSFCCRVLQRDYLELVFNLRLYLHNKSSFKHIFALQHNPFIAINPNNTCRKSLIRKDNLPDNRIVAVSRMIHSCTTKNNIHIFSSSPSRSWGAITRNCNSTGWRISKKTFLYLILNFFGKNICLIWSAWNFHIVLIWSKFHIKTKSKNLFYVNATLPKAVWLQFYVFPSFDFFFV